MVLEKPFLNKGSPTLFRRFQEELQVRVVGDVLPLFSEPRRNTNRQELLIPDWGWYLLLVDLEKTNL